LIPIAVHVPTNLISKPTHRSIGNRSGQNPSEDLMHFLAAAGYEQYAPLLEQNGWDLKKLLRAGVSRGDLSHMGIQMGDAERMSAIFKQKAMSSSSPVLPLPRPIPKSSGSAKLDKKLKKFLDRNKFSQYVANFTKERWTWNDLVGVDKKRYLIRLGIGKRDARRIIKTKDAELDAQDVIDWLQVAGFGKYALAAIRGGITDLATLSSISSKGRLIEIGLKPAHADLLLSKIGAWNESQANKKSKQVVNWSGDHTKETLRHKRWGPTSPVAQENFDAMKHERDESLFSDDGESEMEVVKVLDSALSLPADASAPWSRRRGFDRLLINQVDGIFGGDKERVDENIQNALNAAFGSTAGPPPTVAVPVPNTSANKGRLARNDQMELPAKGGIFGRGAGFADTTGTSRTGEKSPAFKATPDGSNTSEPMGTWAKKPKIAAPAIAEPAPSSKGSGSHPIPEETSVEGEGGKVTAGGNAGFMEAAFGNAASEPSDDQGQWDV